MPGTGKYTVYVPTDTAGKAKHTFLAKLYAASAAYAPTSYDDQAAAVVGNNALGTKYLLATETNGVQAGDAMLYPGGIVLDYKHPDAPDDGASYAWSQAGDPATAHVPDLRAPGSSGVDGVINFKPIDSAPDIKESELKANLKYPVLGTDANGGTSIVSTVATTAKIVASRKLGSRMTLGSSQT